MIESYRTIESKEEGFYKEKGSKFISFAFPVRNEKEIKAFIGSLKRQYFDARHICYAFILGADGLDTRSSDDGEPRHSAGDPILGQIRSLDLTQVLVAVVRYFGGTKLGVPGLVNAYRISAADALGKCRIVEKMIFSSYKVTYSYEATNQLMRHLKIHEAEVISQSFTDHCELVCQIKLRLISGFEDGFDLLKGVDLTKIKT